MADGAVKYDELRREFQELIRNACESDDDRQLLNSFSKARGSDGEKKNAADQSFRDLVKESLLSDEDVETQKHLITSAIKAAAHGTCSTTLPVILLSDVFDTITLDRCDSLFTFVEEQVSTWTMPIFFSSGKNLLLRMCNDLLRRLSASQNTVFCGRIQLFLARLFPLSEKSGLNLMSQFNLDNVTTYATTTEEEDSVNDMETGDGTEAGELVQRLDICSARSPKCDHLVINSHTFGPLDQSFQKFNSYLFYSYLEQSDASGLQLVQEILGIAGLFP